MCRECMEIQEKVDVCGCRCGCWPISLKKPEEGPTAGENSSQREVE